MLWYSIIEPKVFQKVSVERKKSLKSINWWISCLYDNLKASRWWVFVTHERANQQSGQECCFFGSYKFSLKRRSGWPFTTYPYPYLYPYFYPCPIALWTSLHLENMSTIGMNTDWKSLQIYNSYIFIDQKRPLD